MNRAIRIIISIISAWILMGLTSAHCSTLFNKGKSKYVIVLCQNPSQSEQTSAHELQDYLKQIGGVTIPVIEYNQLQDGQKHIFVGFNEKYATSCGVERPQEKDESYAYRTIGDNIWIYGGSERGTMYGVYSFLENELDILRTKQKKPIDIDQRGIEAFVDMDIDYGNVNDVCEKWNLIFGSGSEDKK